MTWTAQFDVQTADGLEAIIATSQSTVEQALARLLVARHLHTPTVHILERPRFGPVQIPDHGLKIDVCDARGLGALAYVGEVPADLNGGGAFITLAAEFVSDPPALYQDLGGDAVYPPNAVIPLDRVRAALIEFWEQGGQRPTCVDWQPVESW
ncbi:MULTISPECIES: Imm1 family immunity protein [unclassified Crossiella]|uniref:Imm1 family immunity protein n=1 Tax=unclassified Crossiella TaxID=2620835 RepID=UPI001FFF39A8|nr:MULTISPECIES: Imm1 family immunity protein [unclassified Crossiella]MCK2240083.1 Imm1 family immunity protein [Crossiella sp. S99.2]MCK2252792.1 Imm1 family immunity protein [Crossiella sp. S99.1]